jgi:hypothetical protein
MAIKVVPDVVAPLAVAAVDIVVEQVAPGYSKWATGILAAGGYAGAFFGFGGDFVKNIGIAALPTFAKNIYNYVKGSTTASRAASYTRSQFQRVPVSSRVQQTPGPGFERVPPMY